MLKFYWNGIKTSDKAGVQRCFYSDGQLINHPEGTLTIYARDYSPFSQEIKEAFKVENDSDIMTDYIVQDWIRVEPTHPLYKQVFAALQSQKYHRDGIALRRELKLKKIAA